MIEKIQKRNGQMVAFDSVKILNAISRANMAVEDEVMEPAVLPDTESVQSAEPG